MQSDLFTKNIAHLSKKDPLLAERLRKMPPAEKYVVGPSKSGKPTLSHVLADGTRKALHSSYDPVQEATQFIDSCKLRESLNYIVGGFGLGYHLLELVKRIPTQSRIIIIEKDPEILRLALEHNDLSPILSHPGISFHVAATAESLEKALSADKLSFAVNGYSPVSLKSLIETDRPYYESLNVVFQNVLQEARVDQKTHAAFSGLFFNNIMENMRNILESPGILPLRDKLAGTPAIIVSAGPSLDKNIHLLKAASERAILITVATAMRFLLLNDIVPDFVVAIDPDNVTIKTFELLPPPGKTWLLYDPSAPHIIPENFKHRRLVFDSNNFLSRWISKHNEEKGELGRCLSVAHTAFQFARYLGCSPILLAGQDLAFSNHRMHCSETVYSEAFQDAIGPNLVRKDFEKQNYGKYAEALVPTLNVFGKNTVTTLALDTYKNVFAEELKACKQVYNVTEGGIPIPGASNLTLKEGLNLYCPQKHAERKKDFQGNIRLKEKPPPLLHAALEAKSMRFRKIYEQLTDIRDSYLLILKKAELDRRKFVDAMERFYIDLLGDAEAVQLLQAYSYPDFLRWNQDNHKIFVKSQAGNEEIDAKFERDKVFIKALLKSSNHLWHAFDKMAAKLNAE